MKRFAIDIGGTFTDLVIFDEGAGKVYTTKLPTTPQDPSQGILNCIKECDLSLPDYKLFVHGTTIGLNAYLQRKGTKTALITTEGFRDVYEIGRINRVEAYNLKYKKPKRLVPRRRVFTVSERMDFRGNVIKSLDEEGVRKVVEEIVKEGVESIAICFMHSYVNPSHEEKIYEIIKEKYPEILCSLSSRIIREYREFERTSVTVLDAYIKQSVVKYLKYLELFFQQHGFEGDFMLQRSGGGVMPVASVYEKPVETLFSGPAGGVMGGLYVAKTTPYKDLILGDVGGTSFDVSIITNGQGEVTTDAKIGDLPVMIPMLDIRSVGTGGGSIAWLDEVNALHVGPQSAGSDPGPVCYERGGVNTTVTDAAVCNNYINVNNFVGGKMSLNTDKAIEAINQKIATPLGLSTMEAANGIIKIMVNKMAGLIREMLIGKGKDPRKYSLLMFGGAGPLFASHILEQLNISKAIIPREPANFSAYGMMLTDIIHDYKQTFVRLLTDSNVMEMKKIFEEMEKSALENLKKEALNVEEKLLKSVDVRYFGQTHALNISIECLSEFTRQKIIDEFSKMHETIYGYRVNAPIQIVRLNVRVIGFLQKPEPAKLKEREISSNIEEAIEGKRKIFLPEGRLAECFIYDREKLRKNDRIQGPAIVEEPSSTTFIGSGQILTVDKWGNLIIEGGRKSD